MKFIISITALLLLSACLKKTQYPIIPVVESVNIDRQASKDVYQIAFTDGDGDLGLKESDTTGNFSSSQKYYYNLFMEYYHYENGAWVKPDLNGVNFYYRIPYLTPEGQNKALKGSINIDIEHVFYFPNVDSVKFEVYIADRALNESNLIETIAMVRP